MQENNQEKSLIKQNISLYLKRKGVSSYSFYKKSKVTRGILEQNNGISESNLAKFLAYAPDVNLEWLITGQGEMLIGNNIDIPENLAEKKHIQKSDFLKVYYDLPATASNIENLCDNELYQDYQQYRVPGFEGCAGFPVVGDSMIPTMQANDIVAVEPQHVQQIINGEIYLVITRDGQRTIKRLVVEESDDDVLLRCISDNPDKSLYKDFLIQGDAVYRVYRVRGAIRLDLFT